MSIIQSIKERLGLSKERQTEIGFMPKERRENEIPKFKLRKDVNAQGQIYLPKETRTFENRSDVSKGDVYSLDIFAPTYTNRLQTERKNHRRRFVDVSVISGHRITIPAEVRKELDIREGDTIAVHAYWQESGE